ncbi:MULTISPECIES: ATP-binding protein [Nonomuraea]|uniref:ATP-binding protein n=1 Tax=Nonomuraea ferruginea TaxID=46174 RepID=A0ABT4T863_9ACTN|nr:MULTISPECIES: ATP-binding protein [Nonomuraea]MDA0645706.1 ATP-binding protein [Nonomuraea ferruginea]
MTRPDVHQPEHDLEMRFPGDPAAVARARGLVTGTLGRDHPLHDDCALLISELATNAVLHTRSGGGGSFTVRLRATGATVLVCVEDAGSDGPPCVCGADPRATSGRGLPMLEALSNRWGYTRGDGTTTVWFELLLVTVPAGWAAEPV